MKAALNFVAYVTHTPPEEVARELLSAWEDTEALLDELASWAGGVSFLTPALCARFAEIRRLVEQLAEGNSV